MQESLAWGNGFHWGGETGGGLEVMSGKKSLCQVVARRNGGFVRVGISHCESLSHLFLVSLAHSAWCVGGRLLLFGAAELARVKPVPSTAADSFPAGGRGGSEADSNLPPLSSFARLRHS